MQENNEKRDAGSLKESLESAITLNVRDTLNGDNEACKKITLLVELPFESIEKIYGTTEEDYYALNILASLRLKMFNDIAAKRFLTSNKNPLRNIFSSIVGLVKLK